MKTKLINTRKQVDHKLVDMLNKTVEKHYGFKVWRIPLLVESIISSPKVLLYNDNDAVLLEVGQETLVKEKTGGVFIDPVLRFQCYWNDIWEIEPLLMTLKNTLPIYKQGSTTLFYRLRREGETLREFVKGMKNNFKPHIFGKKSEQYIITHFIANDNKTKIEYLNIMNDAVCLYGEETVNYFTETHDDPEGDYIYWLTGEMISWWFNVKGMKCGITKIEDRDGFLLGYLTWRKIGKIGLLDDILLNREDEFKPLSLHNVISIHGIWHLLENGCDIVWMGLNLIKETGSYKEVYRPDKKEMPYYTTSFSSVETAIEQLLSIGG
jgi:hypothetical protein